MGVFARLFYLLVLAKKILGEDLYRDRTARRRGLAQLRIFILFVGTERSGGVPGRIRTSDPLLRRYFSLERCASCLGSLEKVYSYRLARMPDSRRI